jgi:hypothetical protein
MISLLVKRENKKPAADMPIVQYKYLHHRHLDMTIINTQMKATHWGLNK